MPLKVQTIISHMEELAPVSLAFTWDNVGLVLGEPGADVKNILISLNLNDRVIEEAKKKDANLIITHHPLLLKPISNIRSDLPKGSLLTRMITSGINLYTAHTNLDIAQNGVNDALAQVLSLQKVKVLQVTGQEALEKLVVFVPPPHVEEVRDALSKAGAGWIGKYSHCTFQTSGTGTFLPREGTNPYIGSPNTLEKVAEERLETILPGYLRSRVLVALFKAHPYEEVAFDL